MRLVIVTAGTRGDVQPFAALGVGLQARGHEVTVATHAPFRALVEGAGLRMYPMPGAPEALFEDPVWKKFTLSRARPAEHARMIRCTVGELFAALTGQSIEGALDGQDAAIFTPTSGGTRSIAERRRLPSILASCTPHHRTREFPQPILAPDRSLGAALNLLSYPICERLLGAPFAEPLRPRARRRHGLSRLPFVDGRRGGWPPFPVLHGFSPALVPRPADWPAHIHSTGHWSVTDAVGASLPAEVEQFLEAGPPPVLITFGSMRPGFHERLANVLESGIARTNARVLVQSPWLDLAGLGSDRCLRTAGNLPHDLLLRRVAAVIHHGGAGTTHAALRAGRPSWVCAFLFDQLFWGHRIAAVGAGPRPRVAAELDPEAVSEAIVSLGAPNIVGCAALVAHAMETEDGVARAAELAGSLLA